MYSLVFFDPYKPQVFYLFLNKSAKPRDFMTNRPIDGIVATLGHSHDTGSLYRRSFFCLRVLALSLVLISVTAVLKHVGCSK